MQETESSDDLAQTPELYRRSLEAILANLPGLTTQALYLAAIPHWFDVRLLGRLLAVEDAAPYLMAIGELSFIQPLEENRMLSEPGNAPPVFERYRCQSEIRALLLEKWPDNQQAYILAHQTAQAYFAGLADNAVSAERPALQREALYHQLVSDKSAGLESLCALFEDAYDRRQFGACQDLLLPVQELLDQLGPEADAWLRYFSARLDLAYQRHDSIETKFATLAAENPNTQLAALAYWNLGQMRLHAGQWSLAITSHKMSLKGLSSQPSGLYVARVMHSLGDVYLDLAEKSGGSQIFADIRRPGRLSRALFYLANLPFLAYQWLVRRIRFMPSSWFFSADYQDWIIVYLWIQAARWYRSARRQFAVAGDRRGFSNTLLSLALIELRKDRWARAEREFRNLLMDETITDSRYRIARVRLGQGELLLRQGKKVEAIAALIEARDTFSFLEDFSLSGEANRWLGRAYQEVADLKNAHEALSNSFHYFIAAGDKLSQTQVAEELESLRENSALSSGARHEIEKTLADHADRQYITRFPNRILKKFRNLSLYVALPVSYFFMLVFIILIGISSFFLVGILEAILKLPLSGPSLLLLTTTDLLILLACILLPLPLTIWSFQFVYRLASAIPLHTIARRVVDIENEPADTIQTNGERIEFYRPSVNQGGSWTWSEILKFTSIDYLFGQQVSRLVSRSNLSTPHGNLVIEGNTRGYRRLKREIIRRLNGSVEQVKLDFNFFVRRRLLVSELVALAYSIYLFLAGELSIFTEFIYTGKMALVVVSQIFLTTFFYGLFLYIPITAWSLLVYLRKQKHQMPSIRPSFPGWLVLLFALVSSLLLIFLGLLPILL